jgi:hypothetical protein
MLLWTHLYRKIFWLLLRAIYILRGLVFKCITRRFLSVMMGARLK